MSNSRLEKLIIQFGRLDLGYQNVLKFSYDGYSDSSDLSSSFLKETEGFKNAKRLIIFPESIVFQDFKLLEKLKQVLN